MIEMEPNGGGEATLHQAPFELNPTIQCNDLKAFERRLMETIKQQRPHERLWRILLAASLAATLVSSYFWLHDSMKNSPDAEDVSLLQSLTTHYVFSANCVLLILLFVFGAHRRIIQSNIIVNRIRQVLYDFALTCDDGGKLIIKQNYSSTRNNFSVNSSGLLNNRESPPPSPPQANSSNFATSSLMTRRSFVPYQQ